MIYFLAWIKLTCFTPRAEVNRRIRSGAHQAPGRGEAAPSQTKECGRCGGRVDPPPTNERGLRLPAMDRSAILVVDDDEITRTFLSDLLVHEGYEVAVAENGRRALEMLQGSVPDLIISDVLMPEMSGFDLFRQVQDQEQLQNLPFIFLTSLDDGDSMIRVKELGPDDYIQKPVRPRHVLASVRGKLKRKQRRDEMAEREQHQIRERIRWTLSHELRTPLTIIQSIAELLLNEGGLPQGKDGQELLQNLRAQSFRLG